MDADAHGGEDRNIGIHLPGARPPSLRSSPASAVSLQVASRPSCLRVLRVLRGSVDFAFSLFRVFAVSNSRWLPWFLSVASVSAIAGAQPATAAALPAGWTARDIGSPSPSGSTKIDGSGPDAVWTLTGTGSDIWNNADQFQFASTTLTGNGGVTARLLSQSGGHDDGWAKTGTMLRETTAAGSRDAYMPYTNGNKFEPSWRKTANTTPTDNNLKQVGRTLDKGPIWIRTQRRGQIYEHLISDDGQRWALMGSLTVPIPASKAVLAGLCASMHGGSKPVVAMFDQVSVTNDIVQPTPLGPSPVLAVPGDGRVMLTYGAVPGALGYNIYRRAADQAPANAIRVNAQTITSTYYTDTGAGGRGLPNGTPFIYTVRAAYRTAAGDLAEGFDSQEVMAAPQVPIPPGFLLYYWNTTQPAAVSLQRNMLSFKASGADIWDIADSGAFLAMPVSGDYTLSVRVVEKPDPIDPNTSNNVKAGPMIREGIGPSDRYAFLFTTSGRGILWEGNRKARNASADGSGRYSQAGTGDGDTIYPQWLQLRKARGVITAFQSDDGVNYTPVGDPQSFGAMPATTYAGIAMSSGNGDGTFTDVTKKAGVGDPRCSTSAAWFDYDRDGWLDLFVCNYCQWTPATNQLCRDSLGRKHLCGPTYYTGARSTLYHNDGDGRFTDVTRKAGLAESANTALGVVVWDYDDDGWPDLVVARDMQANLLLRNNHDGTFSERGVEAGIAFSSQGHSRAGMGIDTGDTTNSGRESILIGNNTNQGIAQFLPDSQGHFTDVADQSGLYQPSLKLSTFGLAFVDYDGDGLRDVVTANGHIDENIALDGGGITFLQNLAAFHNEGGGRFLRADASLGPIFQEKRLWRGLAVGDFDGDGDPDLLVSACNGRPALLRNDGGNKNAWLKVKAVASGHNREGIGTKVTVTAGGTHQIGWIRSGSSYCSQHELTAFFGLGPATQAESVELQFPDGARQTVKDVKANQLIVVQEGKGLVAQGARISPATGTLHP